MVYDLSMRSGLGGVEKYDLLREELLVINAQAIFVGFYFWGGITSFTKK